MNIVVLDGYCVNPGDLSWDALSQIGNLTVYDRTCADDVVSRALDADVVLTNKVPIRAAQIQALPKLKYIGAMSTGVNIIDIGEAGRRGIVVTNIPAYSTESVAQMTFAHILNITNRIGLYADMNRKGRWAGCEDFCYWNTSLAELSGKTIGIVGLGNIGMKVAAIAMAFGMDVFAYTSKGMDALPHNVRKTTLDGLLGVSDIVTLHCPLTDATRGMINKDTIGKMKHGAILINTGRGPLVNEADVAAALRSGQLGGYGADVMCKEPPAADNPLFAEPNAFITPHIAWATPEARARLVDTLAGNLRSFVEGTPVNVINR